MLVRIPNIEIKKVLLFYLQKFVLILNDIQILSPRVVLDEIPVRVVVHVASLVVRVHIVDGAQVRL